MDSTNSMTNLEKTKFKKKIADVLSTWENVNKISSFIGGFHVRHPNPVTFTDNESFVIARLELATKNQLIAIVKKLDIAVPNGEKYGLKTLAPKPRGNKNRIRAFISHSINDKVCAMQFKTALDKYGIEAFVSDEDIKGGEVWQERIITEIDGMKFFIAIHTKHFSKSLWCQQESGLAFARKTEIEIIPINFNRKKAPDSFLTNFQYIQGKKEPIEEVIKEILNTLKDSDKIKIKDLYLKIIAPKIKNLKKIAKNAKDDEKRKKDLQKRVLKEFFVNMLSSMGIITR